MKPRITILVGATASGKTDISVTLAQHLPIEIVNSDSLQVFRFLDIGTSKPSVGIQKKVPHHLIDVLDPDEEFSANHYQKLAQEKIDEIWSRKKIPMFVGGAGFYLKALVEPSSDLPAGTKSILDFTEAYQELVKKDPKSSKIHPNDHYRISRSLFLLDQGILPSEAFQREPSEVPWDVDWLGLSLDRNVLKDRIAMRVRTMFAAGLIDETENVLTKFPKAKDRLTKTIGYRESLEVLSGQLTKAEAMQRTIIRTNQYAKRQGTWFRKNTRIHWSSPDRALDHFMVLMKDWFRV